VSPRAGFGGTTAGPFRPGEPNSLGVAHPATLGRRNLYQKRSGYRIAEEQVKPQGQEERQAAQIRNAIEDLPIEIVENPHWPEGMAASTQAASAKSPPRQWRKVFDPRLLDING